MVFIEQGGGGQNDGAPGKLAMEVKKRMDYS